MNINDALNVREGDYVTHPHRVAKWLAGGNELEPLRVTKVWSNGGGTIVMFRVHALGPSWIHAEAFVAKVPKPSRRAVGA